MNKFEGNELYSATKSLSQMALGTQFSASVNAEENATDSNSLFTFRF
jgi:hypothetical protein